MESKKSWLQSFWDFDYFYSAIIIKVLMVVGIVGSVIGGIVVMAKGWVWQWLLTIIFGPIMVRLVAEELMLLFKIEENTKMTAENTKKGND